MRTDSNPLGRRLETITGHDSFSCDPSAE